MKNHYHLPLVDGDHTNTQIENHIILKKVAKDKLWAPGSLCL